MEIRGKDMTLCKSAEHGQITRGARDMLIMVAALRYECSEDSTTKRAPILRNERKTIVEAADQCNPSARLTDQSWIKEWWR